MKELVKNILEDGKVDEQEVKDLEEAIFEDDIVDKEEAEALFEINDKAEEKPESFKKLFVDGIKAYILADGKIDADEEKFLLEHISADGQVDDNEKALLEALAAETELPESLAALID